MELFKANEQWSTRPDDERFTSLESLYDATKAYADTAIEKSANVADLRVEADGGNVKLVGRQGVAARLTHWSFGQLAGRVGAPAGYLRALPATLAAQNLNHGLAKRLENGKPTVSLLFHQNGDVLLRAITSEQYARIWNYEIAARLVDLQGDGWRPARPDIRVIDDRLPLYASDHDLFAFLSHSDRVIAEGSNNPAGLQRGIIVENSEVGAASLKLTRFLYREMCGNHIIWGAEDVAEISLRHVGNVRDKMQLWASEIRKYMDGDGRQDEAKIAAAQSCQIAATKEQVLDVLFGRRSLGLSRKTLEAGYAAVVPDQDGDPRTAWGMVQGLTRHSQTVPYADERTAIDKAAGKILSVGSF